MGTAQEDTTVSPLGQKAKGGRGQGREGGGIVLKLSIAYLVTEVSLTLRPPVGKVSP